MKTSLPCERYPPKSCTFKAPSTVTPSSTPPRTLPTAPPLAPATASTSVESSFWHLAIMKRKRTVTVPPLPPATCSPLLLNTKLVSTRGIRGPGRTPHSGPTVQSTGLSLVAGRLAPMWMGTSGGPSDDVALSGPRAFRISSDPAAAASPEFIA